MLEIFKDQQVYFGEAGSAHYLKAKLAERGCRRILFVTGKDSFFQSGSAGFFKKAGIDVKFRFSEFEANPTYSDLLAGINFFETVHPECIVAVGGGSVLDMAKLINFFGVSRINPADYLEGRIKSNFVASLLPCVAIPTTAGTGSEATSFSVLYKEKVKYSVADSRMVPDAVILNPVLTMQMSAYQTACTGMDALAQGIESYWAVGATDESRGYAKKAIHLAWFNLEKAVKNPNAESRRKMQEAAYWSGRAINISKTTLCHALSYSLTSYFGYPHGHAVALLLPAVFELHLKRGIISKAMVACFGCADENTVLSELNDFIAGIGIRVMNDFTTSDLEFVASKVNPERMANNPANVSREDIFEVLIKGLSCAQK